jgi:hypothetical protein
MLPRTPRHLLAALLLAAAACGDAAPTASAPACAPDVTAPTTSGATVVPSGARCIELPSGDFVLGAYTPGTAGQTAGPSASLGPALRGLVLPGAIQVASEFPVVTFLGSDTAQVVDVLAGGVAVAVLRRSSSGADASTIARDRAAVRDAMGMLSLLRAVYPTTAAPSSAPGAPLLVLLGRWDPALGLASTWTDAGSSYVVLNLDVARSRMPGLAGYDTRAYRTRTTIHELAHAFEARWRAEQGVAPAMSWAAEGVADLIAGEAARRRTGASANWEWRVHLTPDDPDFSVAVEPSSMSGRLGAGYRDAAAFLRWGAGRLAARSGTSREQALGAVARAALRERSADGPGMDGPVARLLDGDGHALAAQWAAELGGDDRGRDGDPDFRSVTSDSDHGWAEHDTRASLPPVGAQGSAVYLRVAGGRSLPLPTAPGVRWVALKL